MKDTAPKELGIIVVAALFGLVALLVSYLVLDFAGFASSVIGAIVAIISAIVLWLGWREPAAGPTGPRDVTKDMAADKTDTAASMIAPAAAAAPAAAVAAPAAAVAATAPAAAPAPAPAATPAAKKPAAKKPAAKAAKPAAKAAKPAAKAAKPAAKAAKPAAKSAPAKATRAPVAADGKPETLSKARAGGADDLKRIKGVGPQLEGVLNDMGFYHFDQIAAWRKKEVEWVDERLKFKGRIERDEWIKQAKAFAKEG